MLELCGGTDVEYVLVVVLSLGAGIVVDWVV